jgi:ATP-binding cassette subfamily B protein
MGMIVYGVLVSIYVPYILIVLFFMIGTSLLLGVWIYKYRAKHQDEYEKLNTQLRVISTDTTGLDNAKDIRIYRLENWFLRVYDKLIEKNIKLDKGYYRLNFFIGASNSLYEFIRDAVAYFILITLVINKTIDVTTFTFLIGIVAGFSSWSNEFTDSYNELRVANVLMNDYRHALSIEDKMNHDKGIDIKSLSYPLDIKFDHVYFRYPNSDKDVLKDINFEIAPKEKIAIVGNNGAGKTTLIKLLCGLYLPTSGNILINGHRIEEFNIDDYMDLISAVFQDVNPLALTIKENIACNTNHSFDEKKMWDALEKAGLKEKVESLKDKENTFITETFDLSGIRLSGGETQKLMLARALYKDGKLLILDEPTSALDPLSEEKMYKQYLDFTKDNTSIFISHRLASTKFCDQIIFLKDGVIEEVGTHQELIKKNKLYKEMFDIQAKYYKENKGENDTL